MRPPNAGKGRPKGSLNRRSLNFIQVLEQENFDPARALIECYKEAKNIYDGYGIIYQAIIEARRSKNDQTGEYAAPPEDKADKYLRIAADIAKDLASYAYPKLKSIERQDDPLKNMTALQKLEAMKLAVAALETQINEN